MPICNKIEMVKTIDDTADVLRVEFSNGTSAMMLYPYSDAMQYLDKEVTVTFRKDMYDGIVIDFVATLMEPLKVNTFERDTSIKLFSDVPDNHSNVCFADIDLGTTQQNCIVYCSDIKFDSSARASWADLTVIDKMRRVAHLRLFDPDTFNSEFKGKYVKCDMRKSQYGFNTQVVIPIQEQFAINPEVNIAEKFITDCFVGNTAFLNFIYDARLYDFMEKHTDYEPGYVAVRTAIELALAKELANVQNNADVQVVMQAVVASKAFVMQTQSLYSTSIVNIILVSKYEFGKKKETLLLLDDMNEDKSPERLLYKKIVEMADLIIKIKKGQS